MNNPGLKYDFIFYKSSSLTSIVSTSRITTVDSMTPSMPLSMPLDQIAALFNNRRLNKPYTSKDFKKFESAYNLLKCGKSAGNLTMAQAFTVVYKLASSKNKKEVDRVIKGIEKMDREGKNKVAKAINNAAFQHLIPVKETAVRKARFQVLLKSAT